MNVFQCSKYPLTPKALLHHLMKGCNVLLVALDIDDIALFEGLFWGDALEHGLATLDAKNI